MSRKEYWVGGKKEGPGTNEADRGWTLTFPGLRRAAARGRDPLKTSQMRQPKRHMSADLYSNPELFRAPENILVLPPTCFRSQAPAVSQALAASLH